jgi:hypothetical protein
MSSVLVMVNMLRHAREDLTGQHACGVCARQACLDDVSGRYRLGNSYRWLLDECSRAAAVAL